VVETLASPTKERIVGDLVNRRRPPWLIRPTPVAFGLTRHQYTAELKGCLQATISAPSIPALGCEATLTC
jgi:hypothetical protein